MIKVDKASLGTSPPPRIYINKTVLSVGTSTGRRGESVIATTSKNQATQNSLGNLDYSPKRQDKATSSSDSPVHVSLELYLQDIIRPKRGVTWLRSNLIRSRCRAKIIQSTNEALTNELIKDDFNLEVLDKYTRSLDYEVVEIGLLRQLDTSDIIRSPTPLGAGAVVSLVKEASFNIPFTPKHLTFFCVVDVPAVDIGGYGSSRIHGPVTVERVISRSAVMQSSFLLRSSPGTIWAGPAHYHPQKGWMEGYFHTETPHAALASEVINNFKLSDQRILQEIEGLKINPLPIKTAKPHNPISELYLSRTSEGFAAGLFSIDYLKSLSESSPYGNFISTASPSVQRDILAKSSIMSLRVIRDRVQEKVGTSKIQSATKVVDIFNKRPDTTPLIESRDERGRFQERRKYGEEDFYLNQFTELNKGKSAPTEKSFYASVEEVNVDPTLKTRTFAITDAMLGITDGSYQYRVEVKIKDGTHQFLTDRLKELQQAIYGLQNYLNLAMQPENFDSRQGYFTLQFIRSQLNPDKYLIPTSATGKQARQAIINPRDTRQVQAWVGAIVKYIETLDILTDITAGQKKRLARTLYGMVSPACGSLAGIQRFLDLINSLKSQLATLVQPVKVRHSQEKSASSQPSTKTQFLDLSTKFKQIFDANVLKNTGFDYFGITNRAGVLKLRKRDVSSVIQNQLNNLSSNLYDADTFGSSFDYLTPKEAAAFFSDEGSLSYIAPVGINVSGRQVSLWSKDSLDHISLTAAIQSMTNASRGKMLDVEPSDNVLGLLDDFGKGTSEKRLKGLNTMYVDNAVASGVVVGRAATKGVSKAKTASSTDPMGKTNKFTSETPKPPALTVPKLPAAPENVLSVLNTVLAKTNTSLTPSIQAPQPKDISFNMDKENNFFVRSIRPNSKFEGEQRREDVSVKTIKELPPHIKLLARNRENFYNDPGGLLSASDDAKSDGFTYNFGMIRIIEYLAGYEGDSVKRPVWKTLTQAEFDAPSSSYRICRVRKFTNAALNVGIYDALERLPVFNEYFLLAGPRLRPPARAADSRPTRLTSDGVSFAKGNFGRGAERDVFTQLLILEAQQQMLNYQMEYTLTEAPLAPEDGVPRTTSKATMSAQVAAPKMPRSPQRKGGSETSPAPKPRSTKAPSTGGY